MSDSTIFGFEKLQVWQEAVAYARLVYASTAKFPEAERFGLTSQMRRSAVSISSNIAEGASRFTGKDFARFVEIAYGSLMENNSEATIAHKQEFLSEAELTELRRQNRPHVE